MQDAEAKRFNIYFCDHPKELPLLERRDISKDRWQKIRELQQLDTRYNWKILGFVAIWVLAGWFVMTTEQILIQIVCTVLIAFAVNGLPILMHESCHSLLFKNQFLNRWVGFLCGLPGLITVSAYRSIHLTHHAYTRDHGDPDDIEASANKSIPLVFVYYVVLLIGIYLYIPTVAVVGYKKGKSPMKKDILLEYALLLILYALIFWLFPFEGILKLWLYPVLVAAQLSNVRGIAEHGLTTGGNVYTDTRTVMSNKFVSFFMCNLNYHLEHHLFPGVPWYNLPKLHKMLQVEFRAAGASVYRSYSELLVDFFKTTWNGVTPNVRLIPAHIREEVCL